MRSHTSIDEYRAKAMLLDMVFAADTHAFVRKGKSSDKTIYGPDAFWLDADTMEPLDHKTRRERRMYAKTQGVTVGGFMTDPMGHVISFNHIDPDHSLMLTPDKIDTTYYHGR